MVPGEKTQREEALPLSRYGRLWMELKLSAGVAWFSHAWNPHRDQATGTRSTITPERYFGYLERKSAS
jgi:hypothetical protein